MDAILEASSPVEAIYGEGGGGGHGVIRRDWVVRRQSSPWITRLFNIDFSLKIADYLDSKSVAVLGAVSKSMARSKTVKFAEQRLVRQFKRRIQETRQNYQTDLSKAEEERFFGNLDSIDYGVQRVYLNAALRYCDATLVFFDDLCTRVDRIVPEVMVTLADACRDPSPPLVQEDVALARVYHMMVPSSVSLREEGTAVACLYSMFIRIMCSSANNGNDELFERSYQLHYSLPFHGLLNRSYYPFFTDYLKNIYFSSGALEQALGTELQDMRNFPSLFDQLRVVEVKNNWIYCEIIKAIGRFYISSSNLDAFYANLRRWFLFEARARLEEDHNLERTYYYLACCREISVWGEGCNVKIAPEIRENQRLVKNLVWRLFSIPKINRNRKKIGQVLPLLSFQTRAYYYVAKILLIMKS
ncbi:hypothetical protein K0U07_05035 [bacterium]|nr:hypothetical protein [bacterium]